MFKKSVLVCFYICFGMCFLSQAKGWLSSVGSALKSVGSTTVNSVTGVVKGVANTVDTALTANVSLEAAAQLDYCRNIAAIPGGVSTLEYQRNCGNMTFVCQQVRLSDPKAAMDPYCATVSGMGQMIGPWGGTTSAFIPTVNTNATPANTDPNKVGWSIPPPPPYGLAMGAGTGGYGITPVGSAHFNSVLSSRIVSNFFGGNGQGYGRGRRYSANSLEDDDY